MMVSKSKRFCLALGWGILVSTNAVAQSAALLLFDGKTGTEFAGCLNCSKYDDASVCNKYGKFGSQYSDLSIWNRYGRFGSKYQTNSPWNKYGDGLRIVDPAGNCYGLFTSSTSERSNMALISSLVDANASMDNLEALRDLLCEGN